MTGRPRVVALGGGHGLAASLKAIRRYAGAVTAIVSVADDGGSSGRLRATLAIPPPGDLRKCLVALADPGSVWVETFEHRFTAGELEGHAVGNLVIAGLAATTGDFELALAEAGRVLGAVGAVIPATREPVVLKATVRAADGDDGDDGDGEGGERVAVEGQVAVANTDRIAGISLIPPDPMPPAAALEAIAAADQVVIGPGSLFTSVLAVVAVPAIADALRATSARKVYVCNLRGPGAGDRRLRRRRPRRRPPGPRARRRRRPVPSRRPPAGPRRRPGGRTGGRRAWENRARRSPIGGCPRRSGRIGGHLSSRRNALWQFG